MRMIYSSLNRMSDEKINAITQDSKKFLKAMDDGEEV